MKSNLKNKHLKLLCSTALLTTLLSLGHVASADTWIANSPDSIQIEAGQTSYTLKKGDTLWALSQRINVTVEKLASFNAISLTAGEQYHLPIGLTVSWGIDTNGKETVTISGETQEIKSSDKIVTEQSVGGLEKNPVHDLESAIQSIQVSDGMTHITVKEGFSLDAVVKGLSNFLSVSNSSTSTEIEKETEDLLELPIADKIHFLKRFNEASDMILIESNGKYGLVDAGYQTQSTADYAINYLKSLGVEKLEFVLLTHYDEDHWTFLNTQRTNTTSSYNHYKNSRGTEITYLGNKSLLENFSIGRVIARPADEQVYYEPKIRKEIETTLSEYNIPIEFTENFSIGDFNLSVYNNYPLSDEEIQSKTGAISNHNSLAVLVEKDDYNVLLSGDVEKFDEQRLAEDLANTDNSDIDLATAGHHGLSTSNTPEYVEAIGNPVAVVSYTNERLDAKGRENLENYSDVIFTGNGTVVADLTNTEDGITVSQDDTNKEVIIEKNK
ncbi:MBL fold metallo-hydrolase [Streptococcus suis]|uniref:MBL fold metallo-hydrolase n=1 Tax=Streptococcus suis TaxID=1307 RepID=UPI00240E8CF8|nr:MBL fold metallo-hydrolase [Streptococcus suis]WFA76040.1 MBL fold metallo-hydrolase [Streptococcus suis]